MCPVPCTSLIGGNVADVEHIQFLLASSTVVVDRQQDRKDEYGSRQKYLQKRSKKPKKEIGVETTLLDEGHIRSFEDRPYPID